MKIKHLLAAVSLVALSSGAANALTITGVTPSGITPALELELPGSPALTGAYTFTLQTDTGNFPAGNNILSTVTLPAGVTFSQAVLGTDVTGTGVSATVQSGGGIGENSVTFLISLGATVSNNINFSVNLGLDACPTAGSPLTVTAAIDGSGTPIEGGSATTTGLIAPCESALDGTVGPDATADTIISLQSAYTLIADAPAVAGTVGPLEVADLNFTVDPTVSVDIASATPLPATSVSNVTFDLVFEDATFINSAVLQLSGGTGSVTGLQSGNVFSFDVSAGADVVDLLDGVADQIEITVDGGASDFLVTQSLSVANTVVNFNDSGADLIASEAGPTGAVDGLEREGQSFGYFDWNGGEAGRTISQFRITGLPANSTTDFSVQIANSVSSGGSDVDGTYFGTVTANENGVATLSSAGYGDAAVPAHKNHDSLIIIETASSLDMDRLIARNGIVTNYGDGANNSNGEAGTPSNDSDQDNPATTPTDSSE